MWSDEARSIDGTRAVCEEKVGLLLEAFLSAHPEFENLWPAEIVEDALIFCRFHVVDEPLPLHQYALCDMGKRIVVVNSEMNRFVHKWTNLITLRRVTLAHELGHVILHWDEITDRVFRSYQDDERFVDTRAYQKENEANLFSRVFLIPEAALLVQREYETLRLAVQKNRALTPTVVQRLISQLANRFKVNPYLMKSRLADLGWLHPTARRQSWKADLRLRRVRKTDDYAGDYD